MIGTEPIGEFLPKKGQNHLKNPHIILVSTSPKLVTVYGGEKMFISRLDSIISANRSALIKAALEHENEAEIAAYFHVSKREIERIKFGCK